MADTKEIKKKISEHAEEQRKKLVEEITDNVVGTIDLNAKGLTKELENVRKEIGATQGEFRKGIDDIIQKNSDIAEKLGDDFSGKLVIEELEYLQNAYDETFPKIKESLENIDNKSFVTVDEIEGILSTNNDIIYNHLEGLEKELSVLKDCIQNVEGRDKEEMQLVAEKIEKYGVDGEKRHKISMIFNFVMLILMLIIIVVK